MLGAVLGAVLGGLLIPLVSCSSGPEELTPAEWLDQNTVLLQKLESYDARERHEAISVVPAEDHAPDTVVVVVQKGYLLNERLIRAARVIVAAPA